MIHQYKNNGYNIVMDVNSGSVHVVESVVYNAIELLDAEPPEMEEPTKLLEDSAGQVKECLTAIYGGTDVQEAPEDIQGLIDVGQLFTKDAYQNHITDFKNQETVAKVLCLHIAHNCNLACRYRFAEEGEYHGRWALMSFEVGKKALDLLVANSGNRRSLEVGFSDGELLVNWEVVKQLVEYGRSLEEPNNKKFRFTLTTNGILLNSEVEEFCNRGMSDVVLSLDERREVNDKMRPFRNRKSSYNVTVPKFQKLTESRSQMNYYVRGTSTRNNLDFSEDAPYFADLGFEQTSIEPVVPSLEELYFIREEDLPKITEEYGKLAVEYIKCKKEGRGFNLFHFMIDLQQRLCVAGRPSGCGSGAEYLAMTPWGDLCPCHQLAGEEELLLGDVDTEVTNTEICDEFRLCNVYAKDKCRGCFARSYCSGGCAANSHKFHGSIIDAHDIDCEVQKKRIECAIMVKTVSAE